MGHEFETDWRGEVAASPEQVWEAIATGPGIDSWFMGRNQVEAGEGGTVRTEFGGYQPAHRITAWDPPHRLRYGTGPGPDGRAIGYEFLVEGRSGGSAVVRLVVSGFLPDDDWTDEYDAMGYGHALFFGTLLECLAHFPGRVARPVTAFGPPVTYWAATWAALRGGLGLPAAVIGPGPALTGGAPVRFTPAGLPPVDGLVYVANPQTLGIRTGDGLYRFLQGFRGPLIAAHVRFAGTDPEPAEPAWRAWLAGLTR
jgi:uncharacterized protein YndB with AHSA1/START domain